MIEYGIRRPEYPEVLKNERMERGIRGDEVNIQQAISV